MSGQVIARIDNEAEPADAEKRRRQSTLQQDRQEPKR
jgi:hypothetical protein